MGGGHGSWSTATARWCSSAAEAWEVGAYGLNSVAAAASNFRNLQVAKGLIGDHVRNECML
jgi:hypothetical protein